jgi:PAS domain S-box-containing protein
MRVTPLKSEAFRGALVVHTAITDRRRANHDLRTMQDRLASMSRQVSDVIFDLTVEPEGRYRFGAVNPAFLNVTGLREDQVIGKLVQEVIPEPSLSLVLEKYGEAIRERREVRWEETTAFPAGVRHGQVQITPILDSNQSCIRLVGSVRDITASREAENALRESEERFRQMAEHIREVFWMTDAADTRTIYISPAYEEVWGQPCENQYRNPKSFLNAIHPDDRDRVVAALAAHRNLGKYCEEYRVVRPDGSIRWIRDRAFPIHNAAGEIYRVAGIAEDITERISAELRFRSIVENSDEAVVLTDANVVCLYASPGVTRILGFTVDELIGSRSMTFVHPDDLPHAHAHQKRVHAEPHNQHQTELRVRHRDGSWRWIQISDANRLHDPHLKAVVTNFRDITERKLAAETLRQVSEFREAIIQTAAEGICVWSSQNKAPATEISVWNDRMLQITGYTREEINTKGWPQVLFPDSVAPDCFSAHSAASPACAVLHDELYEITRKDGTRRMVSLSMSRLPTNYLEADKCICVALVHDVTDRTVAEEALRQSERKYSGLVNSVDGIVWEANPLTFQFTFISQQAERILGYPISRWTSEPDFWRRHLHPEDREAAIKFCTDAIRRCESHTFTYRMLAADDREVWLQDVVTVVAKHGRAVSLRGVMMDVTEKIRAHATLEQQRRRLEGIINSAMDGIITIDEQQRIVVFNAAAERIFRIRPDEALGQSIERFIPERYRANHAQYVREFGRTGATPRAMGRFGAISGLRTDGEEFPLDASISQIPLP